MYTWMQRDMRTDRFSAVSKVTVFSGMGRWGGNKQIFPRVILNSSITNRNNVMCLEGARIDRQHVW